MVSRFSQTREGEKKKFKSYEVVEAFVVASRSVSHNSFFFLFFFPDVGDGGGGFVWWWNVDVLKDGEKVTGTGAPGLF